MSVFCVEGQNAYRGKHDVCLGLTRARSVRADCSGLRSHKTRTGLGVILHLALGVSRRWRSRRQMHAAEYEQTHDVNADPVLSVQPYDELVM